MGKVPVAPSSVRLVLSGERYVSGFMDIPGVAELNKTVNRYMPALVKIMARIIKSVWLRMRVRKLLRQPEPGDEMPQ